MKLTDVPFECLESCLQDFSVAELVNLADSNKQLRQVARSTYARLFKEKVELRYIGTSPYFEWYNSGKSVIIHSVAFGLKFLRCFGDLISDIDVSLSVSELNPVQWDAVLNYLNEYCSSNLRTMNITCCPEGRLSGLTKPFKNMESLKIVNSIPTERKLSEMFPNIRKLTFCYGGEMGNYWPLPNDFFGNHFPLLEHLSLFGVWRNHYEEIATSLLTHPQLKVLSGDIWYNLFFGKKNILNAKDQLHKFEKLFMHRVTFDRTIEDLGIIHLTNLKELKLVVQNWTDLFNPWNLPFKSDKLESLEIILNVRLSIALGNVHRLFANFPSAKKLKLISSRIDHFDISNSLPLLEEIEFFRYQVFFSDNELIAFISQYHSLKYFSFRSQTPMHVLATILGNNWLVSLHEYNGPNDYPYSYYQIKLNNQF